MSSLPRGRERSLDAAFVVALSAVGFAPLVTSFAGWGWIVVAVVAVLTGILLAELARGWNWPGSVLVLAVLVVYVVLAIPAPSLSEGLGALLPTPQALSEVFGNTVRSWGVLIGTLPRIDSSGPVMLVPLVLGLFPATIAMGLAAMTRSAGLPVVPLAVQLAAALALGRGETTWQLATGIGFAVLALWWVSMRGRRLASGGAPTRVRQLVSGVVVLALAAVLAPLLTDRVAGDRERLVLRETVARGLSTSGIETPLRGFRRFTEQPEGDRDNVHRRALLKVDGLPAGQRLRFAVLDFYDGEQWRPNPDRSPANSRARYLRLSSTIDNPSPGRRYSVEVDVRRPWRLNWVPTTGALQSFEFTNFESGNRRDDLVYNPDTRTALLTLILRGVDDYEFSAAVPDDRLTRDMDAATGVDEDLYLRASFLDTIAQAYLERTSTRMEALFAAAAALKRTGRYSDGASPWEARRFPSGHGLDRLDQQFLHAQQMVGNDEQYAATMALLAIRLGIPARVVVGAVVPQRHVVRGRHVQAWIEVQLADGSWRTLPTERFMGHRPPKRKLPPSTRSVSTWEPPPPPPRQQPRPQQQEQPQTKDEQEKPRPREEDSFPWWLLVLIAITGAIPVAKLVRRHRRRTRSRASGRIAGGWDELTDTARDLGADWTPGLTRPGEARALEVPEALADRADELIFAVADPPDRAVADYWAEVAGAQAALRARVPRWRRVVAPVNPITLLRRRSPD